MDYLKEVEANLINSVNSFMQRCAPFCSKISLHQRRFVILDHSACDLDFTLKINYDNKGLGHLIHQYLTEIIKAIKENKDLYDAGWNNFDVLVEETEVSEYFRYCVFLTVQTY